MERQWWYSVQGRILSATVSQEPSGKYYVSLCCTNVEIPHHEKTNKNIGIDLGIKDLIVTSDGIKIPNLKPLGQSLEKLAKLQRELSRKTRGGSNYNKARIKVARLQEKIKNHITFVPDCSLNCTPDKRKSVEIVAIIDFVMYFIYDKFLFANQYLY